MVRFLCFACVVAMFLFLAGAFSEGSSEPAGSDNPPPIEARASGNPTSCNSSSGTITITMTGMAGDPGDLSGK